MKLLISPENDTKKFYKDVKIIEGNAGFDIYCPQDITISPGETVRVDMKVKCVFVDEDKDIHYFLMCRSSIDKTPLSLSNGVGLMDRNYRGNVIASFRHVFPEKLPYTIKRGTRLVQVVPFNGKDFSYTVVDNLNDTIRGTGGFGSSGL